MSFFELIAQGDAVSRLVALLLVGMSVASWVVILWKVWLLPRARRGVGRSLAAFWQAGSLEDAQNRLVAFDREALVLPLIRATQTEEAGTLAAAGDRTASPWFHSLDGTWDFVLRDRPEAVTAADVAAGRPGAGWIPFDVPGCWTMHPEVDDHPFRRLLEITAGASSEADLDATAERLTARGLTPRLVDGTLSVVDPVSLITLRVQVAEPFTQTFSVFFVATFRRFSHAPAMNFSSASVKEPVPAKFMPFGS